MVTLSHIANIVLEPSTTMINYPIGQNTFKTTTKAITATRKATTAFGEIINLL